MYTITIITLGGAQIGFQFKEGPAGRRALAAIDAQFAAGEPEMVAVADDYGRRFNVRLDEIAGYLGGDPEEMVRGQRDTQLAIQKVAGVGQMPAPGGLIMN